MSRGPNVFSKEAFVSSVREHFGPFLRRLGYKEQDTLEDRNNFVEHRYIDHDQFVSVGIERRERRTYILVGRLSEGRIPLLRWRTPASPSDVNEVGLEKLIQVARRARQLSGPEPGQYESEGPASVDAALESLAHAVEEYARDLFAGDREAWSRAVQLLFQRIESSDR
ncbi:MAG TPA: hypothetical protein VN934_12505 [Candidatus Tumulicola sp.]|nr:hypothetical protein [Candidatus Tumulicola sp.]